MIMVGAGTGLAPFRGFLQERAALRDQGVPVGAVAAVLRLPQPGGRPALRRRAARLSSSRGLVRVENAFSRATDAGRRYVQDAMLDCADEVWDLLQHERRGLRLRQRLHHRARRAQRAHRRSSATRPATGEADAEAWLAGLRATDRFVEDIWGG